MRARHERCGAPRHGRGEQRPYDDPFRYERGGRRARRAVFRQRRGWNAGHRRTSGRGKRFDRVVMPRLVPDWSQERRRGLAPMNQPLSDAIYGGDTVYGAVLFAAGFSELMAPLRSPESTVSPSVPVATGFAWTFTCV